MRSSNPYRFTIAQFHDAHVIRICRIRLENRTERGFPQRRPAFYRMLPAG